MEPNRPVEAPKESEEAYTPGQKALLKILQIGAWMAVFVAMLYAMHS